jgi:hypothetical protein
MTEYDNTNKGTIGKNARKETDNHPDITGSLNVGGVDHWINGWQKTNGSDGSKFYSLSVKPKDVQGRQSAPSAAPAKSDDMDDDIPF